MKKTRVISVIICIIMIMPLISALASASSRYAYKLYDPALDSKKEAVLVNESSVYGQRVILNAPFIGAAFCLPTWNRTDSECTIGVYEWKGDFDSTVKEPVLYERRIAPMRDCATNVKKAMFLKRRRTKWLDLQAARAEANGDLAA